MTVTTAAWRGSREVTIGSTRFLATVDPAEYLTWVSEPDVFVLAKPRSFVDDLFRMRDTSGPWNRIVDLGIFQGGSVAMLAETFAPKALTAIDLVAEPVQALEDFIDARGRRDVVKTWYGVDQGDQARLLEIVEADHGNEPLDLVIDDASHLYAETRASFEVLFPRLRNGGRFVIEDWDWAHYDQPLWQAGGGYFHDRPALTNLIVELLMVAGTGREAISSIEVRKARVEVVRGPAALPSPMNLGDHYLNRGLTFRPML